MHIVIQNKKTEEYLLLIGEKTTFTKQLKDATWFNQKSIIYFLSANKDIANNNNLSAVFFTLKETKFSFKEIFNRTN